MVEGSRASFCDDVRAGFVNGARFIQGKACELAGAIGEGCSWMGRVIRRDVMTPDAIQPSIKIFSSTIALCEKLSVQQDFCKASAPLNGFLRNVNTGFGLLGTAKKIDDLFSGRVANENRFGLWPNVVGVAKTIAGLVQDALGYLKTLFDLSLISNPMSKVVARISLFGRSAQLSVQNIQVGVGVLVPSLGLVENGRKILSNGQISFGQAIAIPGDVSKIVATVFGVLSGPVAPIVSAVANLVGGLLGLTSHVFKQMDASNVALISFQGEKAV